MEGSFQNEVKKAQQFLKPNQEPHTFSDSSYRKLEKMTKEATVTTTDKGCQNKRRYQAMNDHYNAISRVIVWMSMLENLGHNIDDRLHFNTDKSSHYLNATSKLTLLSAIGVKKELAERHRNVTATKTGKEEKNRGFAYTPITNTAGETLAWTTHITDHSFNSDGCVKTYKLDEKRYLQTIPTGPAPTTISALSTQSPPNTDVVPSLSELSFDANRSFVEHTAVDELPELVDIDDENENNDNIANLEQPILVVEKSPDQIEEERLELELMNKFGAQEADQYIKLIYIPVMLERRRKAILEDFFTTNFATTPLNSLSISTSSFMGFIDQNSLEKEAKIKELEQSSRYRILATIDGERNGNNTLKRLYNEQPPDKQVTTVSDIPVESAATISESTDCSIIPDSILNGSLLDLQTGADDDADNFLIGSDSDLTVFESKMAQLNIEFMKHGASCSKIEQISDIIEGGFMTMHQFFNGPMFRKFNMEVISKYHSIISFQ